MPFSLIFLGVLAVCTVELHTILDYDPHYFGHMSIVGGCSTCVVRSSPVIIPNISKNKLVVISVSVTYKQTGTQFSKLISLDPLSLPTNLQSWLYITLVLLILCSVTVVCHYFSCPSSRYLRCHCFCYCCGLIYSPNFVVELLLSNCLLTLLTCFVVMVLWWLIWGLLGSPRRSAQKQRCSPGWGSAIALGAQVPPARVKTPWKGSSTRRGVVHLHFFLAGM